MSETTLRVGIMTGGGDCPGLNAVIRAVVRRALLENRGSVLGIKNGWRGLIDGDLAELSRMSVTGILPRGGTILGTSRVNPKLEAGDVERIRETWERHALDAVVVVGGEGTLRAARDMWREIAAYGGIAGGADVILVPEHPFRLSHVCEVLRRRESQGSAFSIIVIAEDARPHVEEDFLDEATRAQIYQHGRLGGIGFQLALEIEKTTGIETRHANLGYVQRGGSPTAFDRVLATRFGVKAYELVLAGDWGRMVALRGNKVISIPLDEAVQKIKYLDEEIYRVAEVFFC
ncbi:MAG: 6-phosphofructokinase [Acidobacteria bacterium]|nr:6-phosphofructokinase [Acidobacteriota bacterium]